MVARSIFFSFITLCTIFFSCSGPSAQSPSLKIQIPSPSQVIGGPFENGAFMYIDIPSDINAVDTSKAWGCGGQKILITGKIYASDGTTPAPNVVLYYYHTDTSGLYTADEDLNPEVSRHGSFRGWVKSDLKGNYSIFTVRPGSYPNRDFSAHIHLSIKEPDLAQEYYIDALVFDDDPLLTTEKLAQHKNRGGSGILKLIPFYDIQIAKHDIMLGMNIPNYPSK